MPKPTMDELKEKLNKANDDILSSDNVVTEHKADVSSLAEKIFGYMGKLKRLLGTL